MSSDGIYFAAGGESPPAAPTLESNERVIAGPSLSVDCDRLFELERGVRVIRCDKARGSCASDCATRICEGHVRLERSTAGCPGSKLSEMLSFEVLMLLMLLKGATLLKTEEEFRRAMRSGGPPVDYLLALHGGGKVGCSVTRGFGYCNRRFSSAMASALLRRKLAGLRRASLHAADADVFDARVLHVWVRNATDAQTLAAAADLLRCDDDPATATDVRETVLLISIASDALAGLF